MALPTEKITATTFVREGSPPGGTVASPGPQYWSDGNSQWELVQGENGAIFAIAAGLDGATYRQVKVDSAGRLIMILSDGTDDLAVNTDGSINTRGDETIVEDTQGLSTSLTSTANETFVITPTAGTIAELVGWYFTVLGPSGAGSGYHIASVAMGSGTFLWIASWIYNKPMQIMNGMPDQAAYNGNDTSLDQAAYGQSLKGLLFSSTSPLTFKYTNMTDVATTRTRNWNVIYIEREVT